MGSKDETAGCQGCVLTHLEDNRFSLRLRLPKNAAEKYASFDVSFVYGWEHLAWALENLVEGRVVNRIQVRPGVKRWAKVALDRMLEVS